MAPSPDRQIILELVVQSAHPAILEGLDGWLRLGLLSDETVRQVCAENFVCAIRQPVAAGSQPESDFLAELPPSAERSPVLVGSEASRPPRPTGWLAQMAQSFMAELSVVWLLFLGVFMVVVSSGVLAASQWQNFSPVGQYGILLAYTLAFWIASFLTGRRSNLRLTSRMLQIATLLIIPVNFWMMDSFHLSRSASGFGLATIATLLLTAITGLLLKPNSAEPGNTRLILATAIALSWLQWGWGWSSFPLIATYLGTVGASLALAYQDRGVERGAEKVAAAAAAGGEGRGDREDGEAAISSSSTLPAPASPLSSPRPLSSGFIAVAFSTLLLIGRAVFVAQVPVTRLGLAAGICGWLLCWLSRRNVARVVWAQVGTGLLLAGWFVAVTVTPPWQAVAISGLSLWLLADYLRRSGQVQYLTAGFLVGLQAVWLLWRVIPPTGQQWLVNTCVQLAGSTAIPVTLAGLWFFPYLLLIVILSFRLRRWQRPDLAKQAELLALGLGIVLLALSSGNSLVRSLNLILSTLTLASVVVSRRTRPEVPLVYLTHVTGLAAIAACIHQIFPNLSLNSWASILLAGMIAEWSFSAVLGRGGQEVERRQRIEAVEGAISPSSPLASQSPLASPPPPPPWQQSAWYFGFVLAALSYMLLLGETWFGNNSGNNFANNVWSGRWLVTPVALTLLGYRRHFWQQQTASWLSVIALFLAQPLMVDTTAGRLTSLGAATLLMLLNTRQLKHLLAAWVTIGFGLGFVAVAVWEILSEKLTIDWAVNLPAIAVLLLWLLWSWLRQRETILARLYQQATDGWAIILTGFTLLFLTLCNLVGYLTLDAPGWQYVLAAAILLIATSFRTWQVSLIGGFYWLAWSLELLISGTLALSGRSLDKLAISNLALGCATQLLGDWWLVRQHRSQRAGHPGQEIRDGGQEDSIQNSEFATRNSPPYPTSWHLIPLLYAGFGLFLAHHTFAAATGLYTLAAALVGIGIGRRQPHFKPITYLSVFGASFGTYELLLYQLSQAQGGSPGDAIVLLAALAGFLIIALRLLLPWLVSYLRLMPTEIQAVAHIHWAIGNIFLLGALLNSLSAQGEWAWAGIAAVFAVYALVMGNRRWAIGTEQADDRFSTAPSPTPHSPFSLQSWTYTGIIETTFTLAYLLQLLLPEAFVVDWAGAIAVVYSIVLYGMPWQAWGWHREPWRQSAIFLPALVVLLTAGGIALQGLLIVAALYAWLAKSERQVRLSYISILLADWAAVRFLYTHNTAEPLWLAVLLSASLLYVTQLDPELRSPNERDKRHLLRCLATGLVCLTALYQSEVGISGILPILVSMISIGLALGFILVGIWLQVRAFLYIGTLAFIIQILHQLWLFINDYSLLLWAVIGAMGLIFMWIAATFEARRTQVAALVQYWSSELEDWE
jgi:hypothetical protein